MSDPTQRPDGLPGPTRPRAPHDFDVMYTATPPWEIGRPQGAFLALAEAGVWKGRVLDVGCGTGEHALLAASLGLDATGIDSSPRAIEWAESKARERGLSVSFRVGDALALQSLDEQFDTVVDCGLFHVLEDPDRVKYVESLKAVVAPGGRYYMLCFSDLEPGDAGPRRISQPEIRESFGDGWSVEQIQPSIIETTRGPEGVKAWLAEIART